jgi:hypothetical protein
LFWCSVTLLVYSLVIFGSVSEAGPVRKTPAIPGFLLSRALSFGAPDERKKYFSETDQEDVMFILIPRAG